MLRDYVSAQAAMMNWGKQSAFDMFSNLMTFQALASQQAQAQSPLVDHPAVLMASPPGTNLEPALAKQMVSS